MSAALVAALVFALFALGYRYYSSHLSRRIFALAEDEPVPSRELVPFSVPPCSSSTPPVVQLFPRVSYLTRIDLFLLGATVLVFLALGEAVLTSRIARGRLGSKAQSIDRHARWVYALLFFLLFISTLVI